MPNLTFTPHQKTTLLETLSDGLTFSAAGSFLGAHVVDCTNAALSPTQFIAGGLLNAAAIGIGNAAFGTAGLRKGEVNWKKVLVVTAVLAASIIVAPHALKTLSSVTGTALTTEAATVLALFHGAVKTVSYALSHMLLYYKSLELPSTTMTSDEVKELPWYRVGVHYDHFKKNQSDWLDGFTLHARTVFNMRFKDEGYSELLPFKGFTEISDTFTPEQLQFLHKHTNSTDLSAKERRLLNDKFYAEGLPPQENAWNHENTLPTALADDIFDLNASKVNKLTKAELRWIHRYYAFNNNVDAEDGVREALAVRFIENEFLPPSTFFVPAKFERPIYLLNPADHDKHLLGWCRTHFMKHPEEFTKMSVRNRTDWRTTCRNHLGLHIPISMQLDEVEAASSSALKEHYKYYIEDKEYANAGGRSIWNKTPLIVQKALNAKFDKLRKPALQLFPRTAEDLKEIGHQEFAQVLKSNPEFEADLSTEVRKVMSSSLWKILTGTAALVGLIASAYFMRGMALPFGSQDSEGGAPMPPVDPSPTTKPVPTPVIATASMVPPPPTAIEKATRFDNSALEKQTPVPEPRSSIELPENSTASPSKESSNNSLVDDVEFDGLVEHLEGKSAVPEQDQKQPTETDSETVETKMPTQHESEPGFDGCIHPNV